MEKRGQYFDRSWRCNFMTLSTKNACIRAVFLDCKVTLMYPSNALL